MKQRNADRWCFLMHKPVSCFHSCGNRKNWNFVFSSCLQGFTIVLSLQIIFHLEEGEVSQLWGNSYRDKACWNENELIFMEHDFSTSHLGARVNQLLALGPLVLAAFWQCSVEQMDNLSWSHFRRGMASNYYLVVLCISVLLGYK